MGCLDFLEFILFCGQEEKPVIDRNQYYCYNETSYRDNDFIPKNRSSFGSIKSQPTTTNAATFNKECSQHSSRVSNALNSSIPIKSPVPIQPLYPQKSVGGHQKEKGLLQNVSSTSSQVSQSSSKLPVSSSAKPVPTLPLDPHKSIEGRQKEKGLPQNVSSTSSQVSQSSSKFPGSSSSSVKPVPILPLGPHKSIEGRQKEKGLPQKVSSAYSQASETSSKLPFAEHLSKKSPSSSIKPVLTLPLNSPKITGGRQKEKGSPVAALHISESSSSLLERSPSIKPRPLSTKPTLFQTSAPTSHQDITDYVIVKEGSTTYVFPDDIKCLIEKEIVPGVLQKPLSMSTYKDYFHALLYAEDCYLEKWDEFKIENVTLKLQKAAVRARNSHLESYKPDVKDEKVFVEFEIGQKRPFLLSRDFISVRLSNGKGNEFQGIFYRLVRSSLVLAEFGDDFHSQYQPACKYDVKFSFNRVCLKRAHHAIAVASEDILRNFLFPDCPPEPLFRNLVPDFLHENNDTTTFLLINPELDKKQFFALHQIISLKGSPPYIVEGPMSITQHKTLSRTGILIAEASVQVYRNSHLNRILICAPLNRTCDILMRELKQRIPESDLFRANAAFREIDGVPLDILQSSSYEENIELFSCPSLQQLQKFKVIFSTYISSFRLYAEGVKTGHFSHIFLVDASSVTEPEALVPLASLASDKTAVVITGAPKNRSGWIRSPIARNNGLNISYFERLRGSKLYQSLDPDVISFVSDDARKSDGTIEFFSA